MNNSSVVLQCPHCFGKIELDLRAAARSETHTAVLQDGTRRAVDLSIVCVSEGRPRAERFFEHFRDVANDLGAELVIGIDMKDPNNLDGMRLAQKFADTLVIVKSEGFVESVINDVVAAAHGRWIFVLDDDEMLSHALWEWLRNRGYIDGVTQMWEFPTAAVWPTSMTFLTDEKHWPDIHTRLMTWRFAEWNPTPHGGHRYGRGILCPAAIVHYRYLVKPLDERREIYKVRDEGAAEHHHMLLEEHYAESGVTIYELGSGYFENVAALRDKGVKIFPGGHNA